MNLQKLPKRMTPKIEKPNNQKTPRTQAQKLNYECKKSKSTVQNQGPNPQYESKIKILRAKQKSKSKIRNQIHIQS